MDRGTHTFLFTLNQSVHYLQPDGPEFVICARRYEEGEPDRGYTALPARPHGEDARYLYRLRDPHNILGEFWAEQKDLYRVWETPHAPRQREAPRRE